MKGQNDLSRRKFIWRTISSSAVITLGMKSFAFKKDSSELLNEVYFQRDSNSVDPIIPFEFYQDQETEMLDYIITLRKQYGFRKFLLTAPSKEHRYTGFPDKKVFIDIGELIKKPISDIND